MKRTKQDDTSVPKMIPNPDYLKSREFQWKLEKFKESLLTLGECIEDYFPEDYGKQIPEKGGWIMLLSSVHVGKQIGESLLEITLPHLSIWYATPTATLHGRTVDGVRINPKQAIVRHPHGDVHVWPHEYNLVDIAKFLEFGEEDGFFLRPLHPETGGFDEQKLFYLRSRGFSEATAKRMLLPELDNANFCYFEFHPALSGMFTEGTGSPYLYHHNHARRAAAAVKRAAQ